MGANRKLGQECVCPAGQNSAFGDAGVQAGDQGKNRVPHDHNRDYSAFIYPETKALTEWVLPHAGGGLYAFIDLHCPWIRGKYNEFVYSPLKSFGTKASEELDSRFAKIL